MAVETTCPKCQRALRVPEDLLGQPVKCPECEEVFDATTSELPPRPPDESEAVREQLPTPPRRVDRLDEDDDDDDFDITRRRRRDYLPHRATLILVLGIISFPLMSMCWLGFPTGIAAWIMGTNDLRLMRAGVMDPTGESMTNAGRIIGIVVVCLNAIGCLCGGAYFGGMMIWGP